MAAVATAVVSSAVAVAVNLATEWKTNPWAWVCVSVLTVVAAGVAMWTQHHARSADAGVVSIGERGVQIGGDASEATIITGDGNSVDR